MQYFALILLVWNLVVMCIYGADKGFAKRGSRRISEKTLLLLPLFLGGTGAMFGMVLFNHKTSKVKFRLWVPVEVILNVLTIFGFFYIKNYFA